MGVQAGQHRRGHNYEICDPIGPIVFEEAGNNEWGCNEDLTLLWTFYKSNLDQWAEISRDSGCKRTLNEALDRLDKYFLRGDIGTYLLKKYRRGKVNVWLDELQKQKIGNSNSAYHAAVFRCTENDEFVVVPDSSTPFNTKTEGKKTPRRSVKRKAGDNLNGTCPPPVPPIAMTPKRSCSTKNTPKKLNISPLSLPTIAENTKTSRRTSFGNDNDEITPATITLSLNGKRRPSTRSNRSSASNLTTPTVETPTTSFLDFKLLRRGVLEMAKNEATQAFRGRYSALARKSSLELSEAMNFPDDECVKKVSITDSKEPFIPLNKLAELSASVGGNPYFYNHTPPIMSSAAISKFDPEDLQLVTYMPLRDEFEVEYKNDAEKLISSLVFEKETTELEKLRNETIFSQFDHYNRIMKARVAKHAIIREHGILNEFFNIVKTNISEKGKYNLFEDKYFSTKSKEDYYRPIFFRLRQVANRKTINTLARNVGMMETLKEQIEELRALQIKGVKKLKGKLKTESTPAIRSTKRKRAKNGSGRRIDNYGVRKATLRWKRIIRWTKKSNQLSPEK